MDNKICCFTGHRPEKLNIPEEEVKTLLENAISTAINDGFLTFITGMARGIDMWAGEIVLKQKKDNPDIRLVCAVPYEGFEKRWAISERNLYRHILESADSVRFICKHYSRSCFQIRNCYMVDRSDRVIAVYSGKKGGTKNTVEYAKRKGTEIINIFEN